MGDVSVPYVAWAMLVFVSVPLEGQPGRADWATNKPNQTHFLDVSWIGCSQKPPPRQCLSKKPLPINVSVKSPQCYQEQLQQQHQQKQQALEPWLPVPCWLWMEPWVSLPLHICCIRISVLSDPTGCKRKQQQQKQLWSKSRYLYAWLTEKALHDNTQAVFQTAEMCWTLMRTYLAKLMEHGVSSKGKTEKRLALREAIGIQRSLVSYDHWSISGSL